ncbi:hypothetical protein C9374_006330 [Naegleria lovaniensis]|uniref:Uncharacterized protein n=1 Tax=Naegleria lovaniensis TaxID=51637 RepID=A0AA88GLJ8_NAELO|nr:uncharacterized protein C9374_006330 [Naegleria lovaniensis]KAG2381341.1 hypothetical protein C9374_006330 [Naegleria lovaniensis]
MKRTFVEHSEVDGGYNNAFHHPTTNIVNNNPMLILENSKRLKHNLNSDVLETDSLLFGAGSFHDTSSSCLFSVQASKDATKQLKQFELINTIGSQGNKPGEFNSPFDIAIDHFSQLLFISDHDNKRIQTFHLHSLTLKQVINICDKPNYIAIHTNNTLLVTSREYVYKYSYLDGKQIWKLSTPFQAPTGICVDYEGKIYVCDCFSHRIVVLSQNGQVEHTISSEGSNFGQLLYPRGIDLDHLNNLVVCDNGNNRIQVFTRNGNCLNSYQCHHHQSNNLISPESVLVDKSDGSFIITDWDFHQVHVLSSNGHLEIGSYGKDLNSFSIQQEWR